MLEEMYVSTILIFNYNMEMQKLFSMLVKPPTYLTSVCMYSRNEVFLSAPYHNNTIL